MERLLLPFRELLTCPQMCTGSDKGRNREVSKSFSEKVLPPDSLGKIMQPGCILTQQLSTLLCRNSISYFTVLGPPLLRPC